MGSGCATDISSLDYTTLLVNQHNDFLIPINEIIETYIFFATLKSFSKSLVIDYN